MVGSLRKSGKSGKRKVKGNNNQFRILIGALTLKKPGKHEKILNHTAGILDIYI
jgi:hypothetical protein